MDDPASYFPLFLLLNEATTASFSITNTALEIVAILAIVCINGFFVASEFSLVTVKRTRLEARANVGSKGAKAALRLLDEPTTFISAVQLGVTLASLALGWIGVAVGRFARRRIRQAIVARAGRRSAYTRLSIRAPRYVQLSGASLL